MGYRAGDGVLSSLAIGASIRKLDQSIACRCLWEGLDGLKT